MVAALSDWNHPAGRVLRLEALNDDGVPVARAEHTPSGYFGGLGAGPQPAVVPMGPGASASAMVETLAFDKTDGSACTAYAAVRVTLPGAGGSTALPWTSDGCGSLEVHPIVPGTDGRAP